MSPEDAATVAKAVLLGCEFGRSPNRNNKLFYTELPAHHPLSEAQHSRTGFYGYVDPVQMAREYVDYFTREGACQSPPETS